jgi:hypothetical protein
LTVPKSIPNRLREGRELQGLTVLRPDIDSNVGCSMITMFADPFDALLRG